MRGKGFAPRGVSAYIRTRRIPRLFTAHLKSTESRRS